MKVTVTGAFGNIGTAVLAELLSRGYAVRAFDLPSRSNRRVAREFEGRVDVFWGDVRDGGRVREAIASQDAVIHNAAVLPPTSEENPRLASAVNVGGTRAVIEAMRSQPVPPRLVFASSISVHGPMQHLSPPRTSGDPLRPTDEYTRNKVECETMVRASDLPWVILRIGVALDPSRRGTSPARARLLFETSLDTRMELVDRRDVARAMARSARSDEALGKTLLIGGGPSCRIRQRDLVKAVCDSLGIEMLPDAAFGDRNYYTDWMDTEESQRILQYQHHDFAGYRRELILRLRHVRWLLSPVSPLVRRALLRYSPRPAASRA